MNRQAAERIAMLGFEWISHDRELVERFVATSGLALADMSAVMATPEGLAAIMEFVLDDNERTLSLARALGCPAEDIVAARASLPGGDAPHWT